MNLPVMPPVAPMLAKLARELPAAPGMLYEPKWDGFRCIVFRDGDEVELGSRNERPLTRYFPELMSRRAALPRTLRGGRRDRHRRAPRPRLRCAAAADPSRRLAGGMLAASTPASFVAFDVLALDDATCGQPFAPGGPCWNRRWPRRRPRAPDARDH